MELCSSRQSCPHSHTFESFLGLSSVLLQPTQPTTEKRREIEKIGRWYGTDQKPSYICSFSSLCLMDGVSCSMESRCDDRCVAAGREIIFAELFSRVCVTDRVNQSNRKLLASWPN